MSNFEIDRGSSILMDDILLIICLPPIFYFQFLVLFPIFLEEEPNTHQMWNILLAVRKKIVQIYQITRELPGIALVNISTGQIFMGKGNILNYIDILK